MRKLFGLLVIIYVTCLLLLLRRVPPPPPPPSSPSSPSSPPSPPSTPSLTRVVTAPTPGNNFNDVKVTVHILTYSNPRLLGLLLLSLLAQVTDFAYEITVTDNGCRTETREVLEAAQKELENMRERQQPKDDQAQQQNTKIFIPHLKRLELCDNPGYSIGNNKGVQTMASNTSKWVLFLNDDLRLRSGFLQSMYNLGEMRADDEKNDDIGGVGCTLVSQDASQLLESGSIVWRDGTCVGFGRGREDLNSTEFTYARPVDYVSGACLMVLRQVFVNYGGFDHDTFQNYYEDTDLQMHLQHNLNKSVWLQPNAVAHHVEHKSFGKDSSIKMMQQGAKKFAQKWKAHLRYHMRPPSFQLPPFQRQVHLLKASDRRSRTEGKLTILYIDDRLPNKKNGAGYGRSYDNLMMLVELGHHVSLTSLNEPKNWCDEKCINSIQQVGIEVISCKTTTVEDVLWARPDYFDIILVSRPSTFEAVLDAVVPQSQYRSYSVVYDCEALWYRRDEKMRKLLLEGYELPGAKDQKDGWIEALSVKRNLELTWIQVADVLITVSEVEKNYILKELQPKKATAFTVGHTMPVQDNTPTFHQREGILFVGAYHHSMYYNGDAVWYFLKYIYPRVLRQDKPIPLMIAGRAIPLELFDMVKNNTALQEHIMFLESPATVSKLYNQHRIFIVPHLYGAGTQYKLCEAMSFGIPVVTSSDAANNLGFAHGGHNAACIGNDPASFASCILSLYNDESRWTTQRQRGLTFIRGTHDRTRVREGLANVLEAARQKAEERRQRQQQQQQHEYEYGDRSLFAGVTA